MMFTKWVCLFAFMAGCAKKPDSVEFPVVFESWGSASASLGATEDKGVLHIDLKEDLEMLWISVCIYGGPEDISWFKEFDMPEEMREWMLEDMNGVIPKDMLIFSYPLFDGSRVWRDYGNVSCLLLRCNHLSDEDMARERREWLRNIPIKDLHMGFHDFDCSKGYKDIGYIVLILRCKDKNDVSQDIFAILNRVDLPRLIVGYSIF